MTRSTKRGKRGPRSDADTIAVVASPDDDWALAARRTLAKIARYIDERIDDGSLDPLIAIGAFRTLSSAVNDRDAVLAPPAIAPDAPKEPPTP